ESPLGRTELHPLLVRDALNAIQKCSANELIGMQVAEFFLNGLPLLLPPTNRRSSQHDTSDAANDPFHWGLSRCCYDPLKGVVVEAIDRHVLGAANDSQAAI